MYGEKSYKSNAQGNLSVRPSFQAVLADVKRQVDYDLFQNPNGRIEEICKIIAEVLMLDPEGWIKIADTLMPVSVVQEIFRSIGAEHVEFVASGYARVPYLIRNKKAYIRSMLYNTFFELGAHYTNLVNHDLGT